MISLRLLKISAQCILLFWCFFTVVFWNPYWPLHMGEWLWWQRVITVGAFLFYVINSLDRPEKPTKPRKNKSAAMPKKENHE